jgi:hypothetical protein
MYGESSQYDHHQLDGRVIHVIPLQSTKKFSPALNSCRSTANTPFAESYTL